MPTIEIWLGTDAVGVDVGTLIYPIASPIAAVELFVVSFPVVAVSDIVTVVD